MRRLRSETAAEDKAALGRGSGVRAPVEDLAWSLHASYLLRWGRHDAAELERITGKRPEPKPKRSKANRSGRASIA